MKPLKEYILESIKNNDNGGFCTWVETYDELTRMMPELLNKPGLKEIIDYIITNTNVRIKERFILSSKYNYFKMPYVYYDSLRKLESRKDEFPDWSWEIRNGKKIIMKYKKSRIFELGKGSIGRVSTKDQELATCLVWNDFVESMDIDLTTGFDYDYIKNVVKDITENYDSAWILTFQKQVVAVYEYLNQINVDPKDYRMDRYGEGDMGRLYKDFINSYGSCISKDFKKDNIDPSDVILYKNDPSSQKLLQTCKSMCNSIDGAKEAKKLFIKDNFTNNDLKIVGLSLKKISGKDINYELFNVSDDRVKNITRVDEPYVTKTGRGISIICHGDFNIHNIINIDNEEIDGVNRLKLVMRSFNPAKNGNQVAVEVMADTRGTPSLGKCAANVWRSILNIPPSKIQDLEFCIGKFKEYIENTNEKELKNSLKLMIQSSIKDGGDCMPFILLH